MTIAPTGVVELFKNVSLDPTYSKTFFFKNETEQNTYFTTTISSQRVLTNSNVTYQREKRDAIRLQLSDNIHLPLTNYVNIKDVYNCNYMRFRNTDSTTSPFTNKWYYAFILDIEYVNPVTIEVTYQIDVMQTWLPSYTEVVNNQTVKYDNDYELGSCLVLRNHTSSDDIGDNIESESFGDDESTFANNDQYTVDIYDSETDPQTGITTYKNDWYIVILVKNDVFVEMADEISSILTGNGKSLVQGRTMYSGVYNGLGIICVEVNYKLMDIMNLHTTFTQFFTLNGIVAMYVCPAFFAPTEGYPVKELGETTEEWEERKKAYFNKWKYNQISTTILKNMNVEISESNGITPPASFGNYTPINNKMHTYPYSYLYASDNRGNYHFYRYEFFANGKAYFYGEGCFTSQPEMMIYPRNYKNKVNNYEEKMVIDSFPMCAWQSADLVDWLAKAGMMLVGASNASVDPIITTTTNTKKTTNTYEKGLDGQKITDSKRTTSTGKEYTWHKVEDRGGYQRDTATRTINTVTKNKVEKDGISRDINIPIPHISHNSLANTDIMLGTIYNQTFSIHQMQILPEFAYKIDDYFSRFGYAINDVTIPNINARPKFTYIQTSGCCMTTNNIPASVEAEICEIYDNGITFWKDKTEVDKYRYALYEANKPQGSVG